jgi:hypothetical protein
MRFQPDQDPSLTIKIKCNIAEIFLAVNQCNNFSKNNNIQTLASENYPTSTYSYLQVASSATPPQLLVQTSDTLSPQCPYQLSTEQF